MYSSVEGMYARNLDEELYTRDLEAIPYQTGHGGRSGLSTVGAAVAARGINAALEMYRERYVSCTHFHSAEPHRHCLRYIALTRTSTGGTLTRICTRVNSNPGTR